MDVHSHQILSPEQSEMTCEVVNGDFDARLALRKLNDLRGHTRLSRFANAAS